MPQPLVTEPEDCLMSKTDPRIFESAAFRVDTGDDGVIFVRSITIIKRRMWRVRRDVSSRLTN